MTKNDLQAMARPLFIFFGCTIPPFLEFGQQNNWHFLLVPWFVWSISQWVNWYSKTKVKQ